MFSGSSIAVIRASDQEGDPIEFSLDAIGGELLNIDNNGNLTLKEELDREVSAVVDCFQSAFSLKNPSRSYLIQRDSKPRRYYYN